MLFQVTMEVNIPRDLADDVVEDMKLREKQRCQELMQSGVWRHLWRVVGQYKNVSIFDVADSEALHKILIGLPLFPFMRIEVTALCRHPSSIRSDDR